MNQGGDLLVIDSLEEQVGHQPGRVAISAPKQVGDSKIYFKYLLDAVIVNVGLSHRDFSGIQQVSGLRFECSPPHLLKDNMRCLCDQFPPTDQTHACLEFPNPQWDCVSERCVCV